MDTQPAPTTGDTPAAAMPTPTVTKQRFWHVRRWLLIGLAVVLVTGGALAMWVLTHHTAPTPASNQANTNTTNTSTSTSQTLSSANHWLGTVNPAALPLGDGHVGTTAQVGYVDSCTTNFTGGGARHAGSWIDSTNNTWNSQAKVAVEGTNYWPNADYSQTTNGTNRILTTNDLPEVYPTGTFPISRTDPAYQYDTNPNHIANQTLTYTLPLDPTATASPNCLPLGPIGILSDGVVFFNALDAGGRDAVAHETQDLCNGHPNGQEMYHYHSVPSCIRDKATGSSTLVGYAFDGYGIYVERDNNGNLPTNADLDACHGRTSPVMWNGALTTMYHYDATLEYPYTLGCFHGTSTTNRGPQ